MNSDNATRAALRKATPSDAAILAPMNWRLIRDEGHRNPMNVEQLEERMRGWLETDYEAVVFEVNDVVAGYALFRNDAGYVYLRQFFVCEEYRRKGVGRRMFGLLVDQFKTRTSILRLDVLTGNNAGIAFWRAVGFRDYCLTMECSIEGNS